MQKVPILPTSPWQAGAPDVSDATQAVVVVSGRVLPALVIGEPNRADYMARLRNHPAVIIRPRAVLPTAVGRRALVHPASKTSLRTRLRTRDARILRAPLLGAVRVRSAPCVRKTSRQRSLITHRPAIILKAPFVSAVAVTQETIKHVYTRSVVRLRQQRRAAKNPAVILRASIIGVRREKTLKAIYTHSVGHFEQVARRRRHRASLLKTPLRITTPVGRIVLHPVDRTRDRRRRKFAVIFRSRGGVTPFVTEKTLKSIFLHPVTRSARLEARLRRHKARVYRAPIVVTRGKVVTHSVKRAKPQKLRRHRLIVFRSRETGLNRKTIKPLTLRVLRKRQLGWHRRHFAKILRSSGGQSVTEVIFIEPFDQPTPTGRTSSVPTAGDFDYPGPLGRTGSAPSEGTFDIPVPIGTVDMPDPED